VNSGTQRAEDISHAAGPSYPKRSRCVDDNKMSDQGHIVSHEAESHKPLREIIGDILQDVGRIVQAEIRLARTELSEKASRAGRAAGILGAAAVTGLLAGACFITACIAALALAMPVWLAALIMGILLAFAAAGAYAVGRTRLSDIDPEPERTVQTMRDNIEWAKQRNE
jgi:hypothetical protein